MLYKSNLLTLEPCNIFGWDIYFVSIDAVAQEAIILLAFRPCVVVVDYWNRFCIWVELPIQRRLCPIFVSGV